jgi:hypothetical protein
MASRKKAFFRASRRFLLELFVQKRFKFGMSSRIIQVRPSRNPRWQKQSGWEIFEAEGVSPVYCGDRGRESALSYA